MVVRGDDEEQGHEEGVLEEDITASAEVRAPEHPAQNPC